MSKFESISPMDISKIKKEKSDSMNSSSVMNSSFASNSSSSKQKHKKSKHKSHKDKSKGKENEMELSAYKMIAQSLCKMNSTDGQELNHENLLKGLKKTLKKKSKKKSRRRRSSDSSSDEEESSGKKELGCVNAPAPPVFPVDMVYPLSSSADRNTNRSTPIPPPPTYPINGGALPPAKENSSIPDFPTSQSPVINHQKYQSASSSTYQAQTYTSDASQSTAVNNPASYSGYEYGTSTANVDPYASTYSSTTTSTAGSYPNYTYATEQSTSAENSAHYAAHPYSTASDYTAVKVEPSAQTPYPYQYPQGYGQAHLGQAAQYSAAQLAQYSAATGASYPPAAYAPRFAAPPAPYAPYGYPANPHAMAGYPHGYPASMYRHPAYQYPAGYQQHAAGYQQHMAQLNYQRALAAGLTRPGHHGVALPPPTHPATAIPPTVSPATALHPTALPATEHSQPSCSETGAHANYSEAEGPANYSETGDSQARYSETVAPEARYSEARHSETVASQARHSETVASEARHSETVAPEARYSETVAPEARYSETAPEARYSETVAPEARYSETVAPQSSDFQTDTRLTGASQASVPPTDVLPTGSPRANVPQADISHGASALSSPSICQNKSLEEFHSRNSSINASSSSESKVYSSLPSGFTNASQRRSTTPIHNHGAQRRSPAPIYNHSRQRSSDSFENGRPLRRHNEVLPEKFIPSLESVVLEGGFRGPSPNRNHLLQNCNREIKQEHLSTQMFNSSLPPASIHSSSTRDDPQLELTRLLKKRHQLQIKMNTNTSCQAINEYHRISEECEELAAKIRGESNSSREANASQIRNAASVSRKSSPAVNLHQKTFNLNKPGQESAVVKIEPTEKTNRSDNLLNSNISTKNCKSNDLSKSNVKSETSTDQKVPGKIEHLIKVELMPRDDINSPGFQIRDKTVENSILNQGMMHINHGNAEVENVMANSGKASSNSLTVELPLKQENLDDNNNQSEETLNSTNEVMEKKIIVELIEKPSNILQDTVQTTGFNESEHVDNKVFEEIQRDQNLPMTSQAVPKQESVASAINCAELPVPPHLSEPSMFFRDTSKFIKILREHKGLPTEFKYEKPTKEGLFRTTTGPLPMLPLTEMTCYRYSDSSTINSQDNLFDQRYPFDQINNMELFPPIGLNPKMETPINASEQNSLNKSTTADHSSANKASNIVVCPSENTAIITEKRIIDEENPNKSSVSEQLPDDKDGIVESVSVGEHSTLISDSSSSNLSSTERCLVTTPTAENVLLNDDKTKIEIKVADATSIEGSKSDMKENIITVVVKSQIDVSSMDSSGDVLKENSPLLTDKNASNGLEKPSMHHATTNIKIPCANDSIAVDNKMNLISNEGSQMIVDDNDVNNVDVNNTALSIETLDKSIANTDAASSESLLDIKPNLQQMDNSVGSLIGSIMIQKDSSDIKKKPISSVCIENSIKKFVRNLSTGEANEPVIVPESLDDIKPDLKQLNSSIESLNDSIKIACEANELNSSGDCVQIEVVDALAIRNLPKAAVDFGMSEDVKPNKIELDKILDSAKNTKKSGSGVLKKETISSPITTRSSKRKLDANNMLPVPLKQVKRETL